MVAVPGRVAHAIAVSALISAVAVALVDVVVMVPHKSLTRLWPDGAGVFGLALRGYCELLAPLAALQSVLAVIYTLRIRNSRRFHALTTAIAVACSIKSYTILIEYARFVGYVPFMVAWLALIVFLAAGYGYVMSRNSRIRTAVIVVGVVGTLATFWANVTLFSGSYPTFHRALAAVAYLLLQASLAQILALRRSAHAPRAREWGGVLAGLALVSCVAFFGSAASVSVARVYRTFTLVGRSEIVKRPPWRGTCTAHPAPIDEPTALETFARYSSMPELPESFRLSDYNVLLITIDTLRFDDTSLNGRIELTPNLARITKDGLGFEELMSASNQTFQSIISLMTGTYPSHVRMTTAAPAWSGTLQDHAHTAIDAFRDSGFYTFAALHAYMPHVTNSFDARFDKIHYLDRADDPSGDETTANWTLEELDRLSTDQRRFFGWVFLVAPHPPYFDRHPPTPRARDRYRQNVEYADQQLGRIYDRLQANGMLDRTVIIVVGDHGEEFLDHFATGHAHTLYAELLHVPGVVRIPGLRPGTVTDITSATYLFPWLMRSDPGPLGSFARAVIREDLAPMLETLGGAVVTEVIGWDRMKTALIWPDRKIIYDLFSGLIEIFDRTHDEQERNNLVNQPNQLGIEVQAKLDAYLGLRACTQRVVVSDQSWKN